MKECKACRETKDFSEFRQRYDSKDGFRNVCKTCEATKVKIGKVINEVGNTFGNWTVLSRAENKADGSAKWLCKCNCGTEKVVAANTLREGKSFSCGCFKATAGRERRNLSSIENTLLRAYKRGAKDRGFDFELSDTDFKTIIYSNCYYCNDKPSDKKHFYSYTQGKDENYFISANGIDRVDNTKGYTKSNTVSCCKICNRMKSDIEYSVFLEKISKISNNMKKETYEKISNNTESSSNVFN